MGPIKRPIALPKDHSYLIIKVTTKVAPDITSKGDDIYLIDPQMNNIAGYSYLENDNCWISVSAVKSFTFMEKKNNKFLFIVQTKQIEKSTFRFLGHDFKVSAISHE